MVPSENGTRLTMFFTHEIGVLLVAEEKTYVLRFYCDVY